MADELIGSAADGLLGKSLLTGGLIVILGTDVHQRQVVQEGCKRRRRVDLDGVVVHHLAVVIACHIAGLCLRSSIQIQTERHILGGQRCAVMEGNAVTQMEGIAASVITDLPAFSDDTVQLALILEVVAHQSVIDLGIDAVFDIGCPVGGVQRLVISIDGDGQASAVTSRGVAAVAAAGYQTQCHGRGQHQYKELFHGGVSFSFFILTPFRRGDTENQNLNTRWVYLSSRSIPAITSSLAMTEHLLWG